MRPSIDQSIVFTYTDDLPAASTFFREVMELELVVDQGRCRIFRLTPESFLGVCDLPHKADEKSGVMITIVTDDVDGWHDFLTAKGVVYVKGPLHRPEFGIYTSLFVSPHGYQIEIQKFDDSQWHKGALPNA